MESLPDPISLNVELSFPSPAKENRICSSVGLKVRDSAAPLNFLRDPEPTKSLALVVVVSDRNLNRPSAPRAADVVSAAPPAVKRIPLPSSETSSGNVVSPRILKIGGSPVLVQS